MLVKKQHLNTSGLTLVLEDDIELNISRLPELVRRVPPADDWDVIRFYCKRYSNASRASSASDSALELGVGLNYDTGTWPGRMGQLA